MNLGRLTDEELLRHAHVTLDGLTSTALEVELLLRLERHVAAAAEQEAYRALLDKNDIDSVADLKAQLDTAEALDEHIDGLALLGVLRDFDIDDPAALTTILKRDAALGNVLDDLAQPLASLQALITTEQ